MKIIEKTTTANGVKMQLEVWSEYNTPDFPNLYGLTIAAYPIAKNYGKIIKRGKPFRLGISMSNYSGYTNEMVKADFESLKSGEKRLEDLSEHFWNGKDDAYLLGMYD